MMSIEITKITTKGQVVIPQDIRDEKGIKPGERFIVYDLEDSIVLKRVKNLEAARTIDEFEKAFRSTWETAKKRGVTVNDVETEIAAYRREASQR
ncbi:AbrB/MazE/SpoVT family DNA-binding domain-containing protein [Candidatus Woesearchaeota archaeon]|nr:AbrB/MazE/SpoVT family DNA-binding domain-containing protein [Candidatus Woesearchaeota archaeon]